MPLRNATWKRTLNGPVAAMATALWCTAATATPEGGVFLHGDGTISYYGGGLATVVELLGSDRFVVGWNDFDVAAGESVTFNGVNFTVLNTINGGAPPSSWTIDGAINAPGGEVWFVNPAGVMFGETSVLDVGGLLAAAGTINTADFVAGNDVFNLSGDVSFAGTMSTVNGLADRVILLGHHVDNTGLMQGNIIAMASGDTIRLVDLGTRITLEIDGTALNGAVASTGTQASMDSTALVANHGHIETGEGGQVLMASGDTLGAMLGGLAIEHDGEIISAGGTVELIALDGAIRTDQSWAGGNAHVTTSGLIDTSSQSGGGDITLSGPAVVVGSALRSQGGTDGGGGTVSLRGSGSVVLAGSDIAGWDNAAAGHEGTGSISVVGGVAGHDGGTIDIDAGGGRVIGSEAAALVSQGGITGGNGGDVDIRGSELQWNARVRTGAVNGDAGSVAYTSTEALRITADGSISIADFDNLLAAATGDSFIGGQLSQSLGYVDGDLSVHSDGELSFETSLAGLPSDGPTRIVGDATFSGSEIVFADGSGATELRAGGALAFDGDLVLQNSDAVLLAGQRDGVSGTLIGGTVRATGDYRGNLDLSSPGGVQIHGDIGVDEGEIGSLVLRSVADLRFIGDVHAILAQGNVLLTSLDGGPLAVTLGGDLTVQAGNDVLFGDGLTLSGNDSLTAIAGGTLTNHAVEDLTGNLTFIGGTVDNHKALTVGGDLAITATAEALQSNHDLSAGGDLAITSDGGDMSIGGALDADGSIALAAQGDIVATASISAHGTEVDRGLISITTPGTISLTGALTALGDGVQISGGVDVEVAGDINAVDGSVDVSAGSDLILSADIEAETVHLRSDDTMVLDGAAVSAAGSGLVGGTAVQLAAPTINVIGNSTLTAAEGLMKLLGTDGAIVTVAQVNLDDASLHMESQNGDLIFLSQADGDGDLSLSSDQAVLYIGGDLGSDIALRSLSLVGSDGLQLGGVIPLDLSEQSFTVNALTAQGAIALQNDGLDAIEGGVASIRGFSESMSITSNDGDILLGESQGFVQLGDLTMQAAGVIGVTDVTTLGNLTFNAETLRVHRRNSAEILDATGAMVTSPQASIVSGGNLTVSATDIHGVGPGSPPLFGALGTVSGVPEELHAPAAYFQRDDLVFEGPSNTTSLLLQWLERNDPVVPPDPTLIAAESQSAESMLEILLEGNADAVTDDALLEMGIVLRPIDETAGDASRLGRPGTVSVDLVSGPGPAQVGRVVVTRSRLLAHQVQLAVDGWQRAWADGAGVRALGVSGPASMSVNSVGGLFQGRRHLGLDRAALAHLQQALKATYRHLSLAGLTPSEVEASKQYVIGSLVAQGAPPDDAAAAVR